jgi:uncharacterized protein
VRIFLDANILFSAAKSDGAVRQLLSILLSRGETLCVDYYVIEEARRNLAAKHPDALAALEGLLPQMDLVPVAVAAPANHHGLPDKDAPVLHAAVRGRCQVLLTGDKTHFGRLYGTRIEGVEVLPPARLAERLIRAGARKNKPD